MTERKNMTVKEAGKKGGEARAKKYSKQEISEQATRAAQTVEQKQPGFHANIGQKGGMARAKKHNK